MSECERIAQDEWATVSKLLRSLLTNEWMWAIRSGRSALKSKLANRSIFLSELLKKFEQLIELFNPLLHDPWISYFVYDTRLKKNVLENLWKH